MLHFYSNFRSYNKVAVSTTRHEPALCTIAPVTGFKTPRIDKVTAIALIDIETVILN